MRKPMFGVILMLSLFLIVSTAVIVHGELKTTNVVYAWDFAVSKFQNSMVVIYYDGTWVPFLHKLDFDAFDWILPAPVPPDFDPPGWPVHPCGGNPGTEWQGYMWYGLYHEDNSPLGALAFTATRDWSLVNCDLDGDGDFDNADLSTWPINRELYTPLSECRWYTDTVNPPAECTLIYDDHVFNCDTGNCLTEIRTKFLINLDQDCNHAIDVPIPPGGVCFYAEARPAIDPFPVWGGNPQARIFTAGGEKTVNFRIEPTGIDLASLDAMYWGDAVRVAWVTLSETDNQYFNIYRAQAPDGPQVQLNDVPIAVVEPGSPLGHGYVFLDGAVQPGVTYWYWLEDVDINGVATQWGPVPAMHGQYLPLAGW